MPTLLQKKRAGFTLVELLVVIGIIALLIGMAVPAFLSINKGSAMRNAERQVQSANMLARQQALSSRKKVWFCVPYQLLKANGYVRTNMLYRSYFLYSQETAGVATPGSIMGKVQTLPDGVLFDSTCMSTWKTGTLLDTNFSSVLFGMKYLRYGSSGGIYFLDAQNDGVTSYNIVLRPGVPDATTGAPQYQPGTWATQQVNVVSGRSTLLQ